MQELLGEAAKVAGETLYLNFTSATGSTLGIPSITSMSQPINRKLAAYLDVNSKVRCGVLVMDFVTEELCRKVYQVQFYVPLR